MKVVLFCGGLGTRLREHTETVPKPMVNIGQRPILWHLMKYYAHYGHTEFILCLGYMGEQVKSYFINYLEWTSNDFQLTGDSSELHLFNRDIADWKITFADTGSNACIGERLASVQKYIGDDEMFMANYADGLCDLPLDSYVEFAKQQDKIASFVCVHPDSSFHTVRFGGDGLVEGLIPATESEFWVNGGFFVLKREIFDYLHAGEDLVEEPFQRLIAARQLLAYPYKGFWGCMDTYKDKKMFDEREQRGDMPWCVWL